MESDALPARSLLDGSDYATLASAAFDRRVNAEFANRMLFEALLEAPDPALLRLGAAVRDLRRWLHRHWKLTRAKSLIANATLRQFSKTLLAHRDLTCRRESCDCSWCSHSKGHESSTIDDTSTATGGDRA